MKQSIGTTFMLIFIIVFIVVTFAFLSATLSYMKAFKVNTRIANAIEKFEGYNQLAITEINYKLEALGYLKGTANCSSKNGVTLSKGDPFMYCIYDYGVDSNNYRRYGITTYISLDLPIVGNIRVKVYSETEKMFYYG